MGAGCRNVGVVQVAGLKFPGSRCSLFSLFFFWKNLDTILIYRGEFTTQL